MFFLGNLLLPPLAGITQTIFKYLRNLVDIIQKKGTKLIIKRYSYKEIIFIFR